MLKTTSAVEKNDEVNATVQIKNGTESINLSCGEVPEYHLIATWFRVYKFNSEKDLKKILKIQCNKPDSLKCGKNVTTDKYAVSELTNTSLILKNINLSDTDHYRCQSSGTTDLYAYTTLLEVVGKSLEI